jgi:mannitol-specific phosphotransferase system IIBC component
MATENNAKRLVKKIVIGFDLEFMPPTLVRSFTLLRGKIARKRLRIEVALGAITKLPANTDVLFVPEELLEKAQQLTNPDVRIITLDSKKTYQTAFDDLFKNLEDGSEIYAEQLGDAESLDQKGKHGGVIMRYRGSERIG